MTDENIMKTNLTRRSVLIGGAQLLAATAILPRFANAAEELNILVWCDHADTKLIGPFEASHGVKVNVKTYEGTGTALSVLERAMGQYVSRD